MRNIPGGLSFAITFLYITYCEYSRGIFFRNYASVQHLLRTFQEESLSPLLYCTTLNANIPGRLSFAITFLYSTYCEYSRGTLFRHYSSVQHLLRIFQWDTISSLLFCKAFIALTHEMNRADCGYQVDKTVRKICTILYMNELKMLVRYEDELENKIKIVKTTAK